MKDVFRAAKHPLKAGQVRRREWSFLLPPLSDTDPLWRGRVEDYWTLFERLYGVVLHREAIVMRVDYEACIVSTWAAVDRVLPGERRVNYTPLAGMAALAGRSA